MNKDFKYKIENNKLIIESCPNGILCKYLIENEFSVCEFDELFICEGIEEIGNGAFSRFDNIVKISLPSSLNKISAGAFSFCKNLKEVSFNDNLNNSKLEIGEKAFMRCHSLSELNIPDGTVSIGDEAFCFCKSLENVSLPNSLQRLGQYAFSCCYGLTSVKLSSNLKKLEPGTFYYCQNLENIILLEGLQEIEDAAFKDCFSLKNITFPSSLVTIGQDAFQCCHRLEGVRFTEGLKEIGVGAFSYCKSINELVLPNTLKNIGDRAFHCCFNMKKIVMNDGVVKIGPGIFCGCHELEEVELSKNLKVIPSLAFDECSNLKKIVLPDSVEVLRDYIFRGCVSLEEIVLSKNIKKISQYCFSECELVSITIPDGVEEIESEAFYKCDNLKEVYLPTTLKKFDVNAFGYCDKLKFIYIKNKDDIIRLDMSSKYFIDNMDHLLFLYDENNDKHGFYRNGEYTEFDGDLLLSNKSIKKIINEDVWRTYIRLYYWAQKRFVPSSIVIENMPIEDIDKFYINDNGKEWSKLINSSSNITLDQNKASFFKLCYVLGLFSESTSVRDKAVKFLNEKIVNVVDGDYIHRRFDGFDLSNGFNEEYAEFFMKYFDHYYFMKTKDEHDRMIVDLMAASYNNFKNVKKVYPNKTIHTNRAADLLLPEHVMSAVRLVEYDDVEEENKDFATEVGKYGYTQGQFEMLQDWYNKGKTIKQMKLFISEDTCNKGITYKFLDKKDTKNAILGNITNCCQIVGGAGESCVEYGMTKPNSGFITFNYKDNIIGQAWVWYDEKSGTICLDNIEVPHRYLEKIKHNENKQDSFIKCLLRIEENFKKEMKGKGLKVDRVTIGRGCNDIKELLDKSFPLVNHSISLSGYSGYSDASEQYQISTVKKCSKR